MGGAVVGLVGGSMPHSEPEPEFPQPLSQPRPSGPCPSPPPPSPPRPFRTLSSPTCAWVGLPIGPTPKLSLPSPPLTQCSTPNLHFGANDTFRGLSMSRLTTVFRPSLGTQTPPWHAAPRAAANGHQPRQPGDARRVAVRYPGAQRRLQPHSSEGHPQALRRNGHGPERQAVRRRHDPAACQHA